MPTGGSAMSRILSIPPIAAFPSSCSIFRKKTLRPLRLKKNPPKTSKTTADSLQHRVFLLMSSRAPD